MYFHRCVGLFPQYSLINSVRMLMLCHNLGVAFIHSAGFVHQDLKSSNILVFDDYTVKICDFGLAHKKTDTVMLVDRELCTLWYRAPELIMGESIYTEKIDDWSVGCILLEMVIGSPPFRGKPEFSCNCPQVTHRNFNRSVECSFGDSWIRTHFNLQRPAGTNFSCCWVSARHTRQASAMSSAHPRLAPCTA